MGNCALRSVADSAHTSSISRVNEEQRQQRQQEEEGVRVLAISPVRGRTSVVASGDGVWKVKLVIDPEELGQILAEEVNTEALIEQMRIAAQATPRRRKGLRSGLNGSQFLTSVCTSV